MKIQLPSYFRKWPRANFFLVGFLTFAGYYVFLALCISIGIDTREVTIPLRLFICILMVSHLLFFWTRKKTVGTPALIFYLFSFLYLCRVLFELLSGSTDFHIPTISFLLYFLSFGIIPFVFFLQVKSNFGYKSIYWGIFVGALIFAATSFFLYGDLLGERFYRISYVEDLEAISPLSLSYCSALLMGLGFQQLNQSQKSKLWLKGFYIFAIVVGIIPFFLGSSRGSIAALLLSIVFWIFFNEKFKVKFRALVLTIGGITGLFVISEDIGSNIFQRLGYFWEYSITGIGKENRFIIWERSIDQILQYPILGSSLESEFANFYPHNLFLESLITTGVFGTTLLLVLVSLAVYKSIKIIKMKSELSWIPIIFVQAFIQIMFSGGLYSAVWFWSSLGLVFSVEVRKGLS